MSDLEKGPTPEQRLRELLTEAVEPVQPGAGAEARLRSKIRTRRRERDLPRRLRWAGASLGVTALVAGVVVVAAQTGHDDGSAASSSVASGASSKSTAQSAGPSPQGGPQGGLTEGTHAPSAAAGNQRAAAGSAADASPKALAPLSSSVAPSDLDGDHVPDTLTLSGQQLTVKFRDGTQTVTLPQVSSGARVLGVTLLPNAKGGSTPVAFIRLGADVAPAHDTVVAVVAGKLTVLRLHGEPAVLTVTGSGGYACPSYTVSGANLVC
jgi:hypothetical protein